jgi:hypothetical protein
MHCPGGFPQPGWGSQARDRDRKVCFLKKGQIEIPSDMQGLLFEDLDEENPNVPRLDGVLQAWGIECERVSS